MISRLNRFMPTFCWDCTCTHSYVLRARYKRIHNMLKMHVLEAHDIMTTFSEASRHRFPSSSIWLCTAIDTDAHHRNMWKKWRKKYRVYACIPSVWFIFIITWNIHSYIFHVVGGAHFVLLIKYLTHFLPLVAFLPPHKYCAARACHDIQMKLFIYLLSCGQMRFVPFCSVSEMLGKQ